jgi:hypothetical protein
VAFVSTLCPPQDGDAGRTAPSPGGGALRRARRSPPGRCAGSVRPHRLAHALPCSTGYLSPLNSPAAGRDAAASAMSARSDALNHDAGPWGSKPTEATSALRPRSHRRHAARAEILSDGQSPGDGRSRMAEGSYAQQGGRDTWPHRSQSARTATPPLLPSGDSASAPARTSRCPFSWKAGAGEAPGVRRSARLHPVYSPRARDPRCG